MKLPVQCCPSQAVSRQRRSLEDLFCLNEVHLKKRYRLATISNSQDDILAASNRKLGSVFDIMITGETTHTYKPNPALFELVLARAGVAVEEAVHVAQSQYVDLPQSVPMGLQTIWINRQHQKLLPQTPAPALELDSLADLPKALNA